MSDLVQVHAFLPRPLKRRAFSVLALQERTFSQWLRETLEVWLQVAEQSNETMAVATDNCGKIYRPQ